MSTLLTTLLMQLGLVLIARAINSDEDTSELEAKIAATSTEEEVKELAIGEGVKVLTEVFDDPTAKLIAELVTAKDSETVKVAITKPEVRLNLLQSLAAMIGGFVDLLFGKKKKSE